MLIFNNYNEALILDDVDTPTTTDQFWVLDFQIMDFTLASLLVLEEIVASSIELCILGFKFHLPSSWNILVVDPDTQQLDVTEVKDIVGKNFNAFVYGPTKNRHESAPITTTDFAVIKYNVGPSLFKHQMLCHPISSDMWINASPSDGYNKYLKDKVAGDIV